jgi:hypothetical protein
LAYPFVIIRIAQLTGLIGFIGGECFMVAEEEMVGANGFNAKLRRRRWKSRTLRTGAW